MTSPDQDFIINLRYSHNYSILPLKKGNNLILSNFFPEISKDNIILFNLKILSENEASLRTFDYFPLLIYYTRNDSYSPVSDAGIQQELLIRKQTIIYINSLLNIQIFPLFTNNSGIQNKFFSFEKFHKFEQNSRGINHSEESSKNIIFHHETKKDFNEILVDKKNDDGKLNVEYKQNFHNYEFFNQKIKVNESVIAEAEKINEKVKGMKTETNVMEKNNVIFENFEEINDNDDFKLNLENKKKIEEDECLNNKQDHIHIGANSKISIIDEIISNEQIQNKIIIIHKQEEESKDIKISEMPKTTDDVVKIIPKTSSDEISHSKLPSSYQSSQSVNSSYENKLESIKNYDEQYNILYRSLQESIIPRKILVIDDDEMCLEESKVVSKSLYNTHTHRPLIPPRQTRSSSKSVNASDIELLVRKRRRHDIKSESDLNPNKENSNSQNINIVVNKNSKSSDCNVNINETVNNVEKLNECENIGRTEKIMSENVKENVKFMLSPKSENVRQKCTICLDTIKNISRLDKCQHEFCKECIDQWAILSNECPLCKIEFKKIFYWESDSKQQEKKVKKRKFKFEEEDEEPWLRNCAEHCMICNKNNDEHLLLVCDRCSFNICHTYCAGLDLIPDDEWLCSVCSNQRRSRGAERIPSLSQNNIKVTESNITLIKKRTVIVDDCEEVKFKKNNNIVSNSSNSIKTKNTKNINIPISYKLKKDEVNRSSLNLNVNLNLQITNPKRQPKAKNGKLVKKSLSGKITNKSFRFINQNERIKTRRKYNLRKKK